MKNYGLPPAGNAELHHLIEEVKVLLDSSYCEADNCLCFGLTLLSIHYPEIETAGVRANIYNALGKRFSQTLGMEIGESK